MIVKKCSMKVGSLHCKVLALTPRTEHVLVGAYAGAETLGLHSLMYYSSVGLALSVIGSLIYGLLNGEKDNDEV